MCDLRRVYDYSKANVQNINESLDNHFVVFETLAEQLRVSELWIFLKNKMTKLRDAFVPWGHLTARKAKSKPWFMKNLRRLTQKQLRCYRTFCDTPTDTNESQLPFSKISQKSSGNMSNEMVKTMCRY